MTQIGFSSREGRRAHTHTRTHAATTPLTSSHRPSGALPSRSGRVWFGSYRRPLPGDSPGLIGAPAQFLEAQGLRGGRERRVAEQLSGLAALRAQRLEVLVQVADRVGVSSEPRRHGALPGQRGRDSGHVGEEKERSCWRKSGSDTSSTSSASSPPEGGASGGRGFIMKKFSLTPPTHTHTDLKLIKTS